jgi:hypothetical protein
MKKDKSVPAAILGTLYLAIYVFLLNSEATLPYAFIMFSFSPLIIIAMVLYILKYGKPSQRTFDNYFYDDVDL